MTSIARVCKIEGCERQHAARGWCSLHYYKWKDYDDPLFKKNEKHGARRTPEYRIWSHIKGRCNNSKDAAYSNYGGRGITICGAWSKSFLAFLAHVGERPTPQHSLDRINNDGNYEPGNVRWATKSEQALNTRRVHLVTVGDRTQSVIEWAKELNIKPPTLYSRLYKGWESEKALGFTELEVSE